MITLSFLSLATCLSGGLGDLWEQWEDKLPSRKIIEERLTSRGHRSFGWKAKKRGGIFWSALAPAPWPEVQKSHHKYCRRTAWRAAGAQGLSWEEKNPPEAWSRWISASYTCWPYGKHPETWFLWPSSRNQKPSPWQGWQRWLSDARQTPIVFHPYLAKIAQKRALQSQGIEHEDLLGSEPSMDFLGEVKVQSPSPEEAAFWLWESPRHRDFLLKKNVEIWGWAEASFPNSSHKLYVILGAKLKPSKEFIS